MRSLLSSLTVGLGTTALLLACSASGTKGFESDESDDPNPTGARIDGGPTPGNGSTGGDTTGAGTRGGTTGGRTTGGTTRGGTTGSGTTSAGTTGGGTTVGGTTGSGTMGSGTTGGGTTGGNIGSTGGSTTGGTSFGTTTGGTTGGLSTGGTTGAGSSTGGTTGVTDDLTVGNTCTTDAQCEVAGPSDKLCSNNAFASGSANPTAVCIGMCTPSSTGNLTSCDGGRGLCLQAGAGQGVCLPACEAESTGITFGCTGSNRCNVAGFGRDVLGAYAVGYCFGGCTSNSQCPAGEVCQTEEGLCVTAASHRTYTKAVGEACTGRSDTSCSCMAAATGAGVCTSSCITGAAGACPSGSLCTSNFPKFDTTGAVLFTAQPAGLSGTCGKVCQTDQDCPANTICDDNDVAGKTCRPGP